VTIPATNLSLVLTATNKIINNVTNLLSTVNVFLVNPGAPSLLEINHLKPINGLLLVAEAIVLLYLFHRNKIAAMVVLAL
jgi:hypothetical protein